MFPVILDVAQLKIVVIGNGPATYRRLELLDGAQARNVVVFAEEPSSELIDLAGGRLEWRMPTKADIEGSSAVFIADLPKEKALGFAEIARNTGALVNTEDILEGCDFHVPAIVRRGDLLLTVSTGGGSPRLARRLRIMLENLFPESWENKLQTIREKRDELKLKGASFEALAKETDQFLDQQGWLKSDCECLRKVANDS